MRILVASWILVLFLSLVCGQFSPALLTPEAFSSITPVQISPTPSSIPPTTLVYLPSYTPVGTFEFPLETILPSQTLSSNVTVSSTLTPSPASTPTILPLACLPTQAPQEFGLVKWITNGNTIVVDIRGRLRSVRYLGINSPDDLPNVQYMGPPAATQNAAFVKNQIVRLVQDGEDKDIYGRLLRYVIVYDTGVFANFELLRLGLAQTALGESNELACSKHFRLVQELARQAEVGIWAVSPTPFPSATQRSTSTHTRQPTQSATPTPGLISSAITTSPSGTLPTQTTSPIPSITGTSVSLTASPTLSTNGTQIINLPFRGCSINGVDTDQGFTFSQFTLQPGQTCRVFPNQETGTNWCRSFESETAYLNNSEDCGELHNLDDQPVSRFSYP